MRDMKQHPSYKRLYETYGGLCLTFLALVLMVTVLFGFGGAGLSNNGDFGRVMSTNSLAFSEENLPSVYQTRFQMIFQGETGGEKLWNLIFSLENTEAYPSIHLAFVRASLAGNLLLNRITGASLDTYHIQILGLIYILCYAGLLFLLFRSFCLKHCWLDLLVKLLMLFVLCDEGYITYFNSLYSEPVQMLGLLGMAVFALRGLSGRFRLIPNAALCFLSCVVYGWSKFINIPVAVLCILGVGAVLLIQREHRQWKWLIGGGVLCVVLLGAVYLSLPKWMDYETNYNSVFYGVLKDTTPEQQTEFLDALGLPRDMAEYANSNYYMERTAPARESAAFREAFEHVSKFDLLFFYLGHPGYLIEKLNTAMGHSGFIRPYYLGNLGPDAPRLSFANRFGGWSWLRGQLPFDTWWFTCLIVLGGCVCVWLLSVKRGDRKPRLQALLLLLTLLGSMAYQFLMPIVTNGEGDLGKHMFAFAQFIDLLLLLLLAWVGDLLCGLKRIRRPSLLLAGGLAAALVVFLIPPYAVRFVRDRLPHPGPEVGSYVRIGSYGGDALLWQIAEAGQDGSYTLLSVSSVGMRPFSGGGVDGFGSNLWSDSSLRSWLGTDFLNEAFTAQEQEALVEIRRPVLLSGANQSLADNGYNDFFAFHVPAFADRGREIAFSQDCTDLVRLPEIHLLAEFSRQGYLSGPPCWMETPYYNNASMLRVLGCDGYFYMRDASEPYGVRPVITVTGFFTGRGTLSDPFLPT